MKKILLTLSVFLLLAISTSCYKPYPGDLNTVNLNLIIGQSTPADIINVLGEPSSRDSLSGYDTYTFRFYRTVVRVFVDYPGFEHDKILMIDGAEDQLHATFTDGVLTSAY
jgi:hypothetical protein